MQESDGKDSLTKLLGDVEGCSNCCAYFARSARGGRICSECHIYDYDNCTMGVFDDIARRLRELGVGAGKTCAEGETAGDE